MKPENITILTVVDYSVSRDVPSHNAALLYTIVTCVIAFHVSQFLLTQEHLVNPSKV